MKIAEWGIVRDASVYEVSCARKSWQTKPA